MTCFKALLLAVLALAAPQRFLSTTTLLTVDATVTDSNGRPIPDLTPADFEVKVNGKIQPVRAATLLDASGGHAVNTPRFGTPPADTAVLSRKDTVPEPRVFVLLLDDLSIRAGNSKGLLVSAERFVEGLPSQDIVGFTTTSGLVTVNPTTDRTTLMTRLRRAHGQMFDLREELPTTSPFVGIIEALQIADGMQSVLVDVIMRECGFSRTVPKSLDQLLATSDCAQDVDRRARGTAQQARRNAQDQLTSMEGVIRAMGTADGIKHLVVITGGIGVTSNTVDFVPVAKAASAAGIQLSVLAEEPDDIDMSSRGGRARLLDERALQHASQTMTDMSGGQFFRVIGQAERFYDRVLLAASAVYRLGVELPSDMVPGADVTVQVTVAKPGTTVHASHHAAAPSPPPPPLPVDVQVKNAIASGRPLYGVPLQLDPEVVRDPDTDRLAIRVTVQVPGTVVGPLSGTFGLVDEAGQLKTGTRALQRLEGAPTYRLEFLVPVTPGAYRLRFAVADAAGAVGSMEVRVTAK